MDSFASSRRHGNIHCKDTWHVPMLLLFVKSRRGFTPFPRQQTEIPVSQCVWCTCYYYRRNISTRNAPLIAIRNLCSGIAHPQGFTGSVRLERHSSISSHGWVPASYETLLLRICLSAKLEAQTKSSTYLCIWDLEFCICDCFKQENVPTVHIRANPYSTKSEIILTSVSCRYRMRIRLLVGQAIRIFIYF